MNWDIEVSLSNPFHTYGWLVGFYSISLRLLLNEYPNTEGYNLYYLLCQI